MTLLEFPSLSPVNWWTSMLPWNALRRLSSRRISHIILFLSLRSLPQPLSKILVRHVNCNLHGRCHPDSIHSYLYKTEPSLQNNIKMVHVSAFGWCSALQAGMLRVPFPLCLWYFYRLDPSGRTVALGSTRLLTEMSTRYFPWGVKAAGAEDWQLCHVPIV
jgi:hypothetical protein